jgi:magnesium-transporting ATPase (P-type)
MVASSNFGNVFSMLAASAWLPFTPMLGIQILCQNLLYDISQIAIPWDRVDAEYLATPKTWKTWGMLEAAIYKTGSFHHDILRKTNILQTCFALSLFLGQLVPLLT